MFFTYILQSLKDYKFYTGYTEDLSNRFKEHNDGNVKSTRNRRPLKLVYYEVCSNQRDALHREKYLKTAWGKKYIKNRLKHYLTGLGERTTTEIHRNEDSKGVSKLKMDAQRGGKVAGVARKELEKEIKRPVVSKKNYLPTRKTKKFLTE